jgi:hypothetical protein
MRNICAIANVVLLEMYRRKEFYVLFILTVLICLIMGSINIFNDKQIIRYLKELCLLLIWISSLIIAITTTARQIPAEKEQRTLLPLLAKPLSRTQLILGKFLGCWIVCGLCLVCFYLFFGALAASREHAWPLLAYFQAAFLHWMALGVIVAMSLLGSLVFAAPPTPPFAFRSARPLCVWEDTLTKSRSRCMSRAVPLSMRFTMPFPIWKFLLICGTSSSMTGRSSNGNLSFWRRFISWPTWRSF